MAATSEESLIEELRGLPLEKQQEALAFVENLAEQPVASRDHQPIWDVMQSAD